MKKYVLLMPLLCAYSITPYAGSMGTEDNAQSMPFFLELGSGASFANRANLSVDPFYWSGAAEGYSHSLGNSPLYTAGMGYVLNKGINFDANYSYRGLYRYAKFQTPGVTADSVPNPMSTRTRYFNLSSNAVMFNVTLDGALSDKLVYTMANYGSVQPFIGGGLGVSYNTVSDFHTIVASTGVATSTMFDQTRTSLAYQLNAGLEWAMDRVGLDVGYRYFNAGSYASNNFLVTNVSGTPMYVTPWTDTLSSNELFVTVKVKV